MNSELSYRNLGRSGGVRVSPLGLGTLPFGFTVDETTSFAVMDTAIDAGINLFDTATRLQPTWLAMAVTPGALAVGSARESSLISVTIG